MCEINGASGGKLRGAIPSIARGPSRREGRVCAASISVQAGADYAVLEVPVVLVLELPDELVLEVPVVLELELTRDVGTTCILPAKICCTPSSI